MTVHVSDPANAKPWWSFGHVWLVIAGPLVVVIAGFTTFYIAVKSPDPVISTPVSSHASGGDIGQAPAIQARNHAATGALPVAEPKKQP